MTFEQIEDAFLSIGADHLAKGCDKSCEFYRRNMCDSVPLNCLWMHVVYWTLQYDRKMFERIKKQEADHAD